MKPTRTLFQPLFLLTLLIVAGGIFNRAHAQYQSFFGENETYYTTLGDPMWYCTDPDPYWTGGHSYGFRIRTTDTTTVNGIRYYHQVESPTWWVYLREDTTLGRMYRYAWEEDILICDMSLSVGDTFWMPFDGMNSGLVDYTPVPIVVDTIFYVNGLKHIQFKTIFEDYYLDDYGDTVVVPIPYLYSEVIHRKPILFIEGIGPNFGPEGMNWHNGCGGSWFANGQLVEHPSPFLLCVHKDGELVFMSDERAGCVQLSSAGRVGDSKKTDFTLYPNPTRNILNIEFDNLSVQKGTLYITDMVGRVVYSQETAEQHLKINVKRFQSGPYVVTWIAGGKKQSLKFIKK